MAQLVTRVDDGLVAGIDDLVERGVVASRSDAVRLALAAFLEADRRRSIGEAIAEGYRRVPQRSEEIGWADEATRRMIREESW